MACQYAFPAAFIACTVIMGHNYRPQSFAHGVGHESTKLIGFD